ncbi:MAG TPA: SpoIIE family protein phosphatase [Candidatus Baltobacteraceae bacterium]|nr:SpoIIE family protein phosphatase [Candidatus Baltobacteraceae bacterium]
MDTSPERASESFRALAELLPQLVWVSKAGSGQIEYVNRQWLDYFGIDEVRSRSWRMRDFVHPDDFKQANERWKFALLTGAAYEVEYRLRRHDGIYQWFLARGTPARDAAKNVVRWYGSATNIDVQKREVERAKEVVDLLQEAFIPRELPQRNDVRFDAVYVPAEDVARVGGDWYDAFEFPDGSILFSIGDVAGHGLRAAVTMANIRQTILGASIDTDDPSEALVKVNRVLCLQRSIIASALVGFLRGKHVTFCSAGHPPAIFADEHGARFLPHGGMPLGVDADPLFYSQNFETRPGTMLVLYTDGLTEARRRVDEDEQRLLQACTNAVRNGMGAADIHQAVLGPMVKSPDDTAIMTLRF